MTGCSRNRAMDGRRWGIQTAAPLSSLYWDRHFHHARTTFFPTLSVEKRVDHLTMRVDHGSDGGLCASTGSRCCQRRLYLEASGGLWCGAAEVVVDAEGIGRWMAGGS